MLDVLRNAWIQFCLLCRISEILLLCNEWVSDKQASLFQRSLLQASLLQRDKMLYFKMATNVYLCNTVII